MNKLLDILNMLLIGVIVVFLGAIHIPERTVDKELEPYFTDFKHLVSYGCPSKKLLRDPGRQRIIFEEFPETSEAVGVCRTFLNISDIKIDSMYWKFANEDTKYQLVMHELTHCYLKNSMTPILASYPLHTQDERHYMFYRINFLSKWETQRQVIEVARFYCE
jgi:hypothetical protein